MQLKILHFIFIRIVCLPMENTILILEKERRGMMYSLEQWSSHPLTFKLFEKYMCVQQQYFVVVFMVQHNSLVLFNSIWFCFVAYCSSWTTHTLSMTLHQNASLYFHKLWNESTFKVWKLHVLYMYVCVDIGISARELCVWVTTSPPFQMNELTSFKLNNEFVIHTHLHTYKRLPNTVMLFMFKRSTWKMTLEHGWWCYCFVCQNETI